ncbi:hypothetical protein [Micromonospora sp. RTGN7]|uniref:hypothetical protein n=1 Tax=Micromonospora sp. RTGN7 TaxID=3016526 RepID=UPI0029FF4417|nr:hypothetical protein [Micromonospora sp. RTGN7]
MNHPTATPTPTPDLLEAVRAVIAAGHLDASAGVGVDVELIQGQAYASLAAAYEAHQASAAAPAVGDVGRCPRCGQQTRSYSRGCSYCGYGTPTTQAVDQLLDAIRLMTVRYGEATHAYAYAVDASRDVRMRHHRATNRRFLALQRLAVALTAYGAVTGTSVVIEDEVTSA